MLLPLLALIAPLEDLHAIGVELRTRVDQVAPVDARHGFTKNPEDIPAFGDCARPSAAERIALRRLVTRGVPDAQVGDVRFGCVDKGGTIVSATFDDDHIGTWDVVRVLGTRVTPIVHFHGLSRMQYMEWANEESVGVGFLADLDSDGVHDAVIVKTIHEGGAVNSDEELSLWSSRTDKITALGTFSDAVMFARGQLAAPIVLELIHNDGRPRYRCLEARGVIDLCPAIEDARRTDRMLELSDAFKAAALPDRDQLAEQLAEANVEPNRAARIVQAAPETLHGERVRRVIARWRDARFVRRYGEILAEQPADPRPAEIMALGGDTPCTMTASDVRATQKLVASWIAKHDRIDDKRWHQRSPESIVSACGDGDHGYIAAHWTYAGRDRYLMLARDVVFAVSRAGVTPLVSASVEGTSSPCAACDSSVPGIAIDASFYRHGKALLALTLDHSRDQGVVALAVDGKPAAMPAGFFEWARLREPDSTLATIIVGGEAGPVRYFHWDGGWKQVVAVPAGSTELPSGLSPLGQRLWREAARAYAIIWLESFDPTTWADPSVRAEAVRMLELAGADAVTIAKVRAI